MRDNAKRPFGRVPFIARMIGASRLDRPTFFEIRNDSRATLNGFIVVSMAGLSIGFGAEEGLDISLGFAFNWVLWWVVWVFLLYVVAPGLLRSPKEDSDWGQLSRTTGFAQSPAVLLIFLSFVPGGLSATPHLIAVTLVGLWWFTSTAVALQESLHIERKTIAMGIAATWFLPSILVEIGLLS